MFLDVRMPLGISYGCQGGPEFQTRIVTTGAGVEYRTARWSDIRSSWNVGYGIKTNAEWAQIYAFFMSVQGRNYGFRFRDPRDNKAEVMQFGVGNGVDTAYPLYKSYSVTSLYGGTISPKRRITKPCPDENLQVFLNGAELVPITDYGVDYDKGIVNFAVAPAATSILEWTGLFDLPARFDVDKLDATMPEFNTHEWADIPVIELNPLEVAG